MLGFAEVAVEILCSSRAGSVRSAPGPGVDVVIGWGLVLVVRDEIPGFVVPSWRGDGDVPAVSLAPWRCAPAGIATVIVDGVDVRKGDVFVDLGSGDGVVVNGVVERSGCFGVGVEASSALVGCAWADALTRGVGDRVVFLHELIGARGLSGATVVYVWLLPGGVELVVDLIRNAVGSGSVRAVVSVGDVAGLGGLGRFEEIGRVASLDACGRDVREVGVHALEVRRRG